MHHLTGRRFGRLVAIEPTEQRYGSRIIWRCRCDCGREKLVPSSMLINGNVASCGCLQAENRRRDITGERRGHLTALHPVDKQGANTIWAWRCDCGAVVHKSINAVSTSGSTMCPACARALKASQATEMATRIVRDAEGRSVAQVKAIIAGKPTAQNTSGVRGVGWHRGVGRWQARVSIGGKMRTIGYYDTIEEAAAAREEAVRRIYGGEA